MIRQNPSSIDNIDEIEKCLISLGIAKSQLMPASDVQAEFNLFRSTESGIFPLEWFDTDDDEIEFFKSCKLGFAFLPGSSQQRSDVRDITDAFAWRRVQVEVYNEMSNKWRVKTADDDDCHDVSRVYLMFSCEEPSLFAQRIHRATSLRTEYELRLRFEAFVDQIPLSHVAKPPQRIRERIRGLLWCATRAESGWLELFEWEHCMMYQRMQARDEFVRYATTAAMETKTETQPSAGSFFAAIQLPTMDKKLENVVVGAQKSSSAALSRMTFEQSRGDFQRMWLYCCPEAIKIMEVVNSSVTTTSQRQLFHIQTSHNERRVIDLQGFVAAHNGQLSALSSFLHREWIGFIVEQMELHLSGSRRTWFDVDVNDWYVYRSSKLFRLIELVKQRMTMALRSCVRRSTRAYVDALCDPCEGFLTLPEDFAWNSSLMASPFHSERPIFTLSIVFDELSGKYVYSSRDLDEFRVNIIRTFNSTVLLTHEVPHLDPFLVENLKFDRNLRLSSVGMADEEIQHHLQRLECCYRACVRPLMAYVEQFELRFRAFRVLPVSDYLERMKMLNFNELKSEIDSQLQHIDDVSRALPTSSIVIGPFEVEVEQVRSELIVKRKLLHESLRRLLVDRIDSSLASIKLKFDGIVGKLTQHVACVEELVALRNWIPSVPSEVEKLEKQLEDVEYDEVAVLAELLMPLRDEMFGTLVRSRLMPATIAATIEDVVARLDFEFEQFRKLQMTHQVSFVEQVEGIAGTEEMEIYSSKQQQHDDDDDNDDVGGSVGKVWNVLDNLRKHGAMLNNRQRIFNQPDIDMTSLSVLIERVRPYHNFFITTSNFLDSMAKWSSIVVVSVELSVLDAEMKRCEDVVVASRLHFADNVKMMAAIERFETTVVVPARRKLQVLHELKNPDLDEKHLRLMSKLTEIRIEFTRELTLDSLVARGILDHFEMVRDVSRAATSARKEREAAEKEAERKLRAEAELMALRKARLAAREDI